HSGGNVFGLDIDGVPERQRAPVAAFTGEPVPHREGDRREFDGRELETIPRANRPLEDDRPLALVVGRATGETGGVLRRNVAASLAGELSRSRTREIEEQQAHRVLRVSKNEVRLARTRQCL